MKIAIASDHAGFKYKELVKKYLSSKKIEFEDFGTNDEQLCDYPDFIAPAARALQERKVDRLIVLGGSGNGEAIVANRFRGVRCCLCLNVEMARLARMHNDSNAISIGQRLISEDQLLTIVDTWIDTNFEGGRHVLRIEKIDFSAQQIR